MSATHCNHVISASDNPPIGILLCTRKDRALAAIDNQLFVSKYQVELPSKADMQTFIEREIAESGVAEDNSKTGQLVRELRAKYKVASNSGA